MMIDDRKCSPAQVKWMLFGSFLLGALLVAGIFATLATAQDAAPSGEAVYEHWCAPCHAAGPGHPGTQGLQIKYRGTEINPVLVDRTDLTPEVVKTFVRQGVLAMAPFRKTEITDAELDALAAFLAD
jgi:mono/diheme cytochrome c family protein